MKKHIQNDKAVLVTLLIVVALHLLMIESQHPYFFLKDDNRAGFAAIFAHNVPQLLSNDLPEFTFYPLLGLDQPSKILNAVFYPPVYIAGIVSLILFGHTIATIDILVITHILLGAAGFFTLMRGHKSSLMASAFGAITWSMSSFVILASNSWWFVSVVCAAFPWMLYLGKDIVRNPKAKDMILLSIARSALFLSGFPQYFVYAIAFEILHILIFQDITCLKRKQQEKALISFGLSIGLTLSMILVQAIPFLIFVPDTVTRSESFSFLNFADMPYLLDDYLPNLFFMNVNSHDSFQQNMISFLSFTGYIAPLLVALGAYIILENKTGSGQQFKRYALTYLFVLIFCASILSHFIQFQIPFINRFRWQFRLYIFGIFFFCAASSSAIDLIRKRYSLKTGWIFIIVIMNSLIFAAFYATIPQYSFQPGIERFKYSEVGLDASDLINKDPLLDRLSGGRTITLENSAGWDSYMLGYQYPVMKKTVHMGGYEILVSKRTFESTLGLNYRSMYTSDDGSVPVEYLRRWGVRDYLVGIDFEQKYGGGLQSDGLKRIFDDGVRVLYRDEFADPLIHMVDSKEILDYQILSDEIIVKVTGEGTAVLCWLYKDGFSATSQSIGLHVGSDDLGRVTVDVPPGVESFSLSYQNPMIRISAIASIALSILFILGIHIFLGRGA